MADAATAAAELQSELRVRPIKTDRADRAFARSAATCTACHDRFRDRSNGR
jgi:cytochrome c556